MPKNTVSDPDFFLVGMPRSGTSLVEAIINASGQAHMSPECHWMPQFKEAAYFLDRFDHDLGYAADERITQQWKDTIKTFNRSIAGQHRKWGLQIIGDKNAAALDFVLDLYPNARVIHLIRDPRDLLVSLIRTGMGAGMGAFPVPAGRSFAAINGLKMQRPERFFNLRYEDLVIDPESTIRELCRFIGCPFVSEMLFPLTQNISGNVHPALSPEAYQKGELKINSKLTGRWQTQLLDEDLLDLNGQVKNLEDMDYEIFRYNDIELDVIADGPFVLQLVGARDKDGNVIVSESRCRIDVCCVGVMGARVVMGTDAVKRIVLKGFGTMYRSEIYANTYLLRMVSGSSPSGMPSPYLYTWPLFKSRIGLETGSRVGVYTAGGTTRAFFSKTDPNEFNWDCIIDNRCSGTLNRLPILCLDEALSRNLDYIFVTSQNYYPEIKAELSACGLQELRDFCLVGFADQDVGGL